MLIQSKEESKKPKLVFLALVTLFFLVFLKLFLSSKNHHPNSNTLESQELSEVPVNIGPKLFNEELLKSSKGKIYEKGNLSLLLNREFGLPTLTIVYKDSISKSEKEGRFLVFLYLKDPTAWRSFNKKYDHILLTKEHLVPVEKKLNGTTYYIYKFRLEHPFFQIENLKELEFVRHIRGLGRFEEINFKNDSTFVLPGVSSSLKTLRLSLKSSSLNKIALKRNEALKSGILITDDSDYVNAKVTTESQASDARVRLKGDWTDHLEHPIKWSFRIVSKGEKTMFRMRKFSVQHPKSRNYIWEWLFNKVVKDNDLVGLRYDFLNVDIEIVDKDSIIPMGIMAMEEGFDKILVENNRRREGLILGFDETTIWNERKKVRDLKLDYPEDVRLPKTRELPVKVYNERKVLTTPLLKNQFEIAKNLIVGLRDGKLTLSQTFDTDKLAFYIALSNLFGGHHGLHVENIRIYYNPVTNKLEPISFDSNSGNKLSGLREYPIGIHDKQFKEKLVSAYERVSSKEFIYELINRYALELNSLTLDLLGEFNDSPMNLEILLHNANFIKKEISPSTTISTSMVSFQEGHINLKVRNHTAFPVVLDGLVLKNGKTLNQPGQSQILPSGDTLSIDFRLKKAFNNAFVSKKNKEGGFRFPKDLPKIQLKHHLLGSKLSHYGPIKPFVSEMDNGLISSMELKNKLKEFPFVIEDKINKKIHLKAGNHTLNRILYVPAGYELIVEPGFHLDFADNASIISHSPIYCKGTKDKPIYFTSENNTGGGIFITSTNKLSVVSYTNFKNLSVPRLNIWQLSGAVNFNEAAVSISNSSFQDNRSEDALNIIRTHFVLDSTTFTNTYSDSFDGDFVEGKISNSTFTNSGNDGIDVSGSRIHLENILINNPLDKGLSAGEDSEMTGKNITIANGEIAIVSKDFSQVNLSDITIRNTRLGMACFQKKTEFGPGTIHLKQAKFTGVEVTYLIEPSSELNIDGVPILDKSENVIDLMYGKEYGKSSK